MAKKNTNVVAGKSDIAPVVIEKLRAATEATKEVAVKEVAPTSIPAPTLTAELIEALRAAESHEAAVRLLAPDARPKAKADATFTLNTSCQEPLPQKRGACLKVVAAAVRLNKPFKVADIVAELPTVKSAAYWTRKLAKTGHLMEA